MKGHFHFFTCNKCEDTFTWSGRGQEPEICAGCLNKHDEVAARKRKKAEENMKEAKHG